jgi:hypothetical protein
MEHDRAFLEKLKEKIDKLNSIQHEEIYKIITDNNIKHTKSSEGVFILSSDIIPETYSKIIDYIQFCETIVKNISNQ